MDEKLVEKVARECELTVDLCPGLPDGAQKARRQIAVRIRAIGGEE